MSKTIGMRDNEIFLGNHSLDCEQIEIPAELRFLKTIRLGAVALDCHGNSLPTDECRPLFLDRSEADDYDRFMMDQFRKKFGR